MKKLVTAEDVCKAKSQAQDIYIDKNTIVTAQARDIAKEHGVKIIEGQKNSSDNQCSPINCDKDVKCCNQDRQCEKTSRCCEQALSAEEIYKVLSYALESGILKESDLTKLL